MSHRRTVVQSVFYAGLVSLIVNAHGVAKLTIRPGLEAGQLNFVLAPLLMCVMLLVVLLQMAGAGFRLKMDHTSLLALALLASCALLGFGFGLLPYSSGVSAPQIIRDTGFLWLIPIVAIAFDEKINRGFLSPKVFIKTLVLVCGVILPIAGYFLLPFRLGGRYGGFALTSSMMGNIAFLLILVAYEAKVSAKFFYSYLTTAGVIIIATGTRVAFVLYAGFLLYYFGFQKLQQLRRARRLIVLILLAGVALAVGERAIDLVTQQDTQEAYRVVSVQDVEAGSIATRVLWLTRLWERMTESMFFGGFGAGQAEAFLGVIPHFDVLRFWFDYSVVYLVLFTLMLRKISFLGSNQESLSIDDKVYRIFLYGSIFVLTVHNAFQDTAISLLIVLTCVLVGRTSR